MMGDHPAQRVLRPGTAPRSKSWPSNTPTIREMLQPNSHTRADMSVHALTDIKRHLDARKHNEIHIKVYQINVQFHKKIVRMM